MCFCIGPSLHMEEVIAEHFSDLRETISDVLLATGLQALFLDLNHEILVHSNF